MQLYASADTPVVQKVVGAVVLLVVAWVLLRAARRQVLPILRDRAGRAWAWSGAVAFVFLFAVSKTIDGFSRKASDATGIPRDRLEAEHPWMLELAPFEEILELGLPAVMIILSLQFLARRPLL